MKFESITIGCPMAMKNNFVFVAIDLQHSLIFCNENGLVAMAQNYKETILIDMHKLKDRYFLLLDSITTHFKSDETKTIDTFKMDNVDLNKPDKYARLIAVDYHGKDRFSIETAYPFAIY